MEESKELKNIGFFKKLWYSITKFEKYSDMAIEGFSSAIKYLIILTAIITVFSTISSLIEMHKLVENLAKYIEENIPEFTYQDGKINMELAEDMVINNIQYDGIDRVILSPNTEEDLAKEQVITNNEIVGTTVIFFKDQIILRTKRENNTINEKEYTYKDFIKGYTQEDINQFNKAELIQYMTGPGMYNYYYRYSVSAFIYMIFFTLLSALFYAFQLSILGLVTALVARIKITFVAIYNMSIYALTLSTILNIIYIVINYFTTFTTSYFQVAYITIAYIYLAAAIFIIKDDFIKKQQEVDKIKEEQKKVRDEIERQEQKNPEDKEEKNKEDKKKKDEKNDTNKNDGEPTGSEA